MTKEDADKIIKDNEALVIGCTYNILFTNDIVCSVVIEALEGLKKSAMYRQETKRAATAVERARKEYERYLNSVVERSSEFFADANDKFTEELGKDLNVLYYTIKGEMDRKGVKESGVLARMEEARMLADYAVWQFDRRMKELAERDKRFKGLDVGYLRIDGMLKTLNRMMESVRTGVTVDMNIEQCRMALDVVALKLSSPEAIARAIAC